MTAAPSPARTSTAGAFDDMLSLSTTTDRDGVVTVSATGDIDAYTAPLLRSVLDGHLQRGRPHLVLDLSGVQFLGSAGLAALVETQKSASARGIHLRLIATTRAVTRVLEVTGLSELFAISAAGDQSPRSA
jgi:anti-sigma B factor antagonist